MVNIVLVIYPSVKLLIKCTRRPLYVPFGKIAIYEAL